jgi:sialate O-acetylesterase
MKAHYYKYITFFLLISFWSTSSNAEDLRKFVSLSGYWKFSIGDDNTWASPSYDDSNWDQIAVPDQWENQGYEDYNGYAWYRKTFKVGDMPSNTIIYLMLGRIDDVEEVYLNGKLLGKNGSFPPNYITAYNRARKYTIPAGYLNKDGENVIAIKVYDAYLEGGIVDGPTGLYYDLDVELLDLNLSGRWKIHRGDNKEWKSTNFDDNSWQRINVPTNWENEVFEEYDGYAWYRVKFKVPEHFISGDLYLSLGKIDDIDNVYLNGKYIGCVYDLRKDNEYRRSGWEYNARRLYKIDNGLLIRNGINTLAVRVYDGQERGGIYEGPIGIMSAENYRRYKNKHYSSRSFWDYVFDNFIEE